MADGNRVCNLRTDALSYQYGTVDVWQEVTLSVSAGEIVFLVGENGSGKSTLLRCLAGLTSPKSGRIFLDEVPFSGRARKQRSLISFVSDTPSFYDDLTAKEHLKFVLAANRRLDEYLYAEELFERFGLTRHLGQYPSSYSRGMREKLALVLAFAVKPQILLLDEPYNPLDYKAAEVLSSELRACASRGVSVILSSHRAITDLLPDRVFFLEDGTLSEDDHSLLSTMWGITDTLLDT